MKTTYGHVITYFHKLFQTVSQMLMKVDKLKQVIYDKLIDMS